MTGLCMRCGREVELGAGHPCSTYCEENARNREPLADEPSLDAAHLAPILLSIRDSVKAIERAVCEDDGEAECVGQQLIVIEHDLTSIHNRLEGVIATQADHTATLARIEAAVTVTPPGPRSLGGFVAAIHGKGCKNMATIPVPKLLDTEKILLSVMPRKEDGHVDATASVTWTAAGDVGVEPGTEPFDFTDPQFSEVVTCPGSFNCFALTPNASGTGSVTASASGYESAEFGPIEYAPGVPRSLNASVGAPVSDII